MKTNLKKVALFPLFFCVISASFGSCSKVGLEDDNNGEDTTGIIKDHFTTYYIDSKEGNDANAGTSEYKAWKTLLRLDTLTLKPGDFVRFKRGSEFVGPLFVRCSGTKSKYITLSDYGDSTLHAPSFTNTEFVQDNFGNCIRVKGSYVIVENLYCHHTSAYKPGNYVTDGGWITWEMGAIYIDKGAKNCIVRNNEMFDCLVSIKSYGENAIIENNYVHDCNRILAEWNWGPIGIWLGADFQEVRYNRIINISVVDPHIVWGNGTGGADGGAMEIDDARYEKTHISIHHNYSRECQGFLEVTWSDVLASPKYENFSIHHNVCDDYQQFIALWRGANCRIENNTIIRRRENPCNWGVFNITQRDGHNLIQNNIIVVEKNIRIFNLGLGANDATPNNIINNNLYFAASGTLDIGKEGPGGYPVYGDPNFVNYATGNKAEDFAIKAGSPAINKGLSLGYTLDFTGTTIPQSYISDIGAFEYK
ncbi:MAG: choice-of-anchor Q domain-containing protein [Bacteroidales bacterium]